MIKKRVLHAGSDFCVFLRIARRAQRLQIERVVGSAARKWNDVVLGHLSSNAAGRASMPMASENGLPFGIRVRTLRAGFSSVVGHIISRGFGPVFLPPRVRQAAASLWIRLAPSANQRPVSRMAARCATTCISGGEIAAAVKARSRLYGAAPPTLLREDLFAVRLLPFATRSPSPKRDAGFAKPSAGNRRAAILTFHDDSVPGGLTSVLALWRFYGG